MNPFAKHFSTIKASDLVLVDSDGYVTEGGAQLPINEAGFMIHSEIHKARPDVVAAAHTHGVYGKTWSAFGKPIEMLTQGLPLPPNDKIYNSDHTNEYQMLATFTAAWAYMMITVVSRFLKKKESKLQRHSARITSHVFFRITGEFI
jgi:hypothetical protein